MVGYQDIAAPVGNSMRTSTFKALNGKYKISDIQVKNAEGAGGDTIQVINTDGSWGNLYYYYTMEGSGWLEDGWYQSDGATPVTDEDAIDVGEAFIVTAATSLSFTFAGQVVEGKPEIPVPVGYSIIGNPTPVTVKLNDIAVSNATGAGGDTAQKINADGSWGDLYYYYTMDGSGWLEDGWYESDGATPVSDDAVLAAGESMIFSSDAGMTLTFPKAL